MEHSSSFLILLSIAFLSTTVVESAPISPERKVIQCYWPDCRERRVNSSEVREVFLTDCRLNRVIVFGDGQSVKIRDLHNNICSKYILIMYFYPNLDF